MPKDKIPYDEIYFQRDSSSSKLKCGFSTTGIDSVPSWFAPEFFSLAEGNAKITMRCIRKDENWCQVVVNNKTGEQKWIELGNDIVFADWLAFYLSAQNIEFSSENPQLHEKPNAKSRSVPVETKETSGSELLIRPVKIQGNWMYVELAERDVSGKETAKRSGWIRWRDSEKPLIRYNLRS